MKTFFSVMISLLIAISGTGTLDAEVLWEPLQQLSETPTWSYLGYNNSRCMAVWDATVHVIWGEAEAPNNLYYIRSADKGVTWNDAMKVSLTPSGSAYPSIAVEDSLVYVLWQDWRDGNLEMYFRRSSDDGQTWDDEVRLTTDPARSRFGSMAASGTFVHVVWEDNRNATDEVYYKRSVDAGQTWDADVRLVQIPSDSCFPCVAVKDSNVYVVWSDARSGSREIYFKRSADAGMTWSEDTRLTDDPASSWMPTIEVQDSVIYLAWMDRRFDYNFEIFTEYSLDRGETWSSPSRVSNAAGYSMNPSLAARDSSIYVSWHDTRDGNFEIYFAESHDLGATWNADTNLSQTLTASYSPFVALTDSFVNLIYHDLAPGNSEILYLRGRIPVKPVPGVGEERKHLGLLFDVEQSGFARPVLSFYLPEAAEVELALYDPAGRRVATLAQGWMGKGSHRIALREGGAEGSGVYFCTLRANGKQVTRKIIALR